jgi:hypothetical protein
MGVGDKADDPAILLHHTAEVLLQLPLAMLTYHFLQHLVKAS